MLYSSAGFHHIHCHLFVPPSLPSSPRYGASTKAAIIRIGLLEMWSFITNYHGGENLGTLLESCGVADLIATCSGGRNRRVSEAMVLTGKVGVRGRATHAMHDILAVY